MPAEKPFTGLTASVKIGSGDEAKVLAYISGRLRSWPTSLVWT